MPVDLHERIQTLTEELASLRMQRETLEKNFDNENRASDKEENRKNYYLSELKQLSTKAKKTDARLAMCLKQINKLCETDEYKQISVSHHRVTDLIKQMDEYLSDIKWLKRNIEDIPRSCRGGNKVDSETALKIFAFQLHGKFLIRITCCDVIEEIFLKLAGVTEKPAGQCEVGYDLDILDNEKLEFKHTARNSIFFHLPVSDSAIKKLEEFSKKNTMEFHDYTHILSEENSKPGFKLIRIGADKARFELLPNIKDYLNQHPKEQKKYLEKTREKLIIEHNENNNEAIKKIDSRIKALESSVSKSWCRLYADYPVAAKVALAAGMVVVGATLGAKAFSKTLGN